MKIAFNIKHAKETNSIQRQLESSGEILISVLLMTTLLGFSIKSAALTTDTFPHTIS